MQMTSSNHRQNFRSNDVPFVLHQTDRFENYPLTDYENSAIITEYEELEELAYRISYIVPDEVIYDLPQDYF